VGRQIERDFHGSGRVPPTRNFRHAVSHATVRPHLVATTHVKHWHMCFALYLHRRIATTTAYTHGLNPTARRRPRISLAIRICHRRRLCDTEWQSAFDANLLAGKDGFQMQKSQELLAFLIVKTGHPAGRLPAIIVDGSLDFCSADHGIGLGQGRAAVFECVPPDLGFLQFLSELAR